MAGGQPFTGTFDGGGHTLTVNISSDDRDLIDFPFIYHNRK